MAVNSPNSSVCSWCGHADHPGGCPGQIVIGTRRDGTHELKPCPCRRGSLLTIRRSSTDDLSLVDAGKPSRGDRRQLSRPDPPESSPTAVDDGSSSSARRVPRHYAGSGALPLEWRIDREHDLPPRWDGFTVTWSPWELEPVVTICPPPAVAAGCERCGSRARRQMAVGLLRRFGDPHSVRSLFAWRCPRCELDTVYDLRTGECWTLDASDYGAAGSVA